MSNTDKPNGSNGNGITTQPLPSSKKIYVQSAQRPDVRVPIRAITVSSALDDHSGNGHSHSPVMVYDTSGPYTDANVGTDIRKGLGPLRLDWIGSGNGSGKALGAAVANLRNRGGRSASQRRHVRRQDALRRPACSA